MTKEQTDKVKAVIKKIYGNDGQYHEGRWFTKDGGTYVYTGIKFAKKEYPNECPDVARMVTFVGECKSMFGNDCPQSKAFVCYSPGEHLYLLLWVEKKY